MSQSVSVIPTRSQNVCRIGTAAGAMEESPVSGHNETRALRLNFDNTQLVSCQFRCMVLKHTLTKT